VETIMLNGFFLVCLMGICGLPAAPPLRDPIVPVSVVEGRDPMAPSGAIVNTSPAVERPAVSIQPVSSEVVERPVAQDRQDHEDKSDVVPAQASAGKPSKAVIADVVRHKSGPIRHCYELALAEDRTFSGTVEIAWRIRVDGHVSSVSVSGSSQNNSAVEACMRAEIMRWEFPPSSEPIVVGGYPFVFDASLLARHGAREPTSRP
jgi:outer membrane biosynthesis protein TonB